jgi:hypothetical protein
MRIPGSPISGRHGHARSKPVQRIPEAKLLGASKGFAEPHGHVGRQHRRCAGRVGRDLIAEPAMWLRRTESNRNGLLRAQEAAQLRQQLLRRSYGPGWIDDPWLPRCGG